MSYSPQLLHDKLAAALAGLTSARKFLIGLSGGLDSVVLLHAAAALRDRQGLEIQIRALHINHQLQEQSDDWERHCRSLCAELGVEYRSARVEIPGGAGIENAARDARYREFEAALLPDEELLLAHHRDDQMETILLRLNRGSGSRGLGGMPRSRVLGASRLLRPFLDIDCAELRSYAESAQLNWVEDHSNEDESFDRNYCRHKVLPLIETRWPGYRESWSKSAQLSSESEELLQDLAAIDLSNLITDSAATLSRQKLLALSEPRRRNVLRYWLASCGASELGWNSLQQLSNEVLQGSAGQFLAEDFQIFCFRETVSLLSARKLGCELVGVDLGAAEDMLSSRSVTLPDNGVLHFRREQGEGVCVDRLGDLSIRYRQGGETCRLEGRPTKSLKKILQEIDMPPWLRSRVPLLYNGADLVAIPGVGVSEQFAAKGEELGCLIEWERPDLSLSA